MIELTVVDALVTKRLDLPAHTGTRQRKGRTALIIVWNKWVRVLGVGCVIICVSCCLPRQALTDSMAREGADCFISIVYHHYYPRFEVAGLHGLLAGQGLSTKGTTMRIAAHKDNFLIEGG